MAYNFSGVIYITGSARSGGTVLGRVLGQAKGVHFVGEVKQLWGPNPLENRLCGCGKRVLECPIWQTVFQKAFGGISSGLLDKMWRWRAGLTRTRHIPMSLITRHRLTPSQRDFGEHLKSLYNAIADVLASSWIVDSSRLVPYGLLLESCCAKRMRVLHLVRDPRAVVYSWQKEQAVLRGQVVAIRRQSPLKTIAEWIIQNAAIEAAWQHSAQGEYQIVRYEDFAVQPAQTLHTILCSAGIGSSVPEFDPENRIWIAQNHSCGGNISYRLQDGLVRIQPDEAWKSHLKPQLRRFTEWATLPWLKQYGYSRV